LWVFFSVYGCFFWHNGDFLGIFQGPWMWFLTLW
jgi:hypothetical protein